MCGIIAIIHSRGVKKSVRQRCIFNSRLLRHRGPDWTGVWISADGKSALGHERLAIVDPLSGEQPLLSPDGSKALAVNGEIYNHGKWREDFKNWPFKTQSDCEVILPLYEEFDTQLVQHLDGMFAFVLYDEAKKRVVVARDPMGITTLYMGKHADGSVWFASEAKALQTDCATIEIFPPGFIYSTETGMQRYYAPAWWAELVPRGDAHAASKQRIRELFTSAVRKRLMTDVPFGVLLSGGLDSSLVASVATRLLKEGAVGAEWGGKLHSFCIGLKGAPDLAAAQKVADAIGTKHTALHFTVQDGIDCMRDLIYKLETYDVTTIRASTPMYLLSRKIKALGIKMVLSGEGADELMGGYLYFHNAPSDEAFHKECCRRVKGLHMFDNLRANKSTMAWGLEARVPFLDKDFVNYIMQVDAAEKRPMRSQGRIEKHLIRSAFDTKDDPYLPKEVLWRQKEQFSDGVGYSWIDGVRDHAAHQVTDEMFAKRNERWTINVPETKEAYMYREIFDELFPHASMQHTVEAWVPMWTDTKDPSGRAIKNVHDKAYTGKQAKL